MRKKFVTIDEVNNGRPEGSILTGIEFIYKPNKKGKRTRYVKCMCDRECIHELPVYHLITYKTCVCHRVENLKKNATKFYPVVPKLLKCYTAMMHRCYNKKTKCYPRYGGKGVVVCEEWKQGYQNFINWALANGYEDGLCLDKDIKGDGMLYSPDTCCWVTNLENQSYKSNSVKYYYHGEMLTLGQIAREEGIKREQIFNRLQFAGTTLDHAIYLVKNKLSRKWKKNQNLPQSKWMS